MKMQLEVPEYSPERGIHLMWDDGAVLIAEINNGSVSLKGNTEGLLSLARHLLTLSQQSVPSGSHIHFDSSNAFEDGSCEIVVERL